MIKKNYQSGFTLNELLMVAAILVIMAGSVVLIVNPGEIFAQARDSKRVGELNGLSPAITIHENSVIGGYKGEINTVYISLPDTSSTCANLTNLPALSVGWTYNCVTESNLQNPNGTGWLPVNLNAMPGGSPFNQLPIDPENNSESLLYYAYIYGSSGYTLTAAIESEKQAPTAAGDGGYDPDRYEKGTDLSLWGTALGL